ncbi:MAG: FmdE family protein [Candidatus Hodarchaeota archaeon]
MIEKELIKRTEEFHGHVGPFIVAGLKMGLLALEKLNAEKYSGMKVVVETGTTPPISCIVDGIQMSTGCTLGKGNIEVLPNNKPTATFTKKSDNQQIRITLKNKWLQAIADVSKESMEELAEKVLNTKPEELFETEVG